MTMIRGSKRLISGVLFHIFSGVALGFLPSVFAQEPLLSEINRITVQGARSGEGYFSPDGSLMAFQSERDSSNPFYQIYIQDLAKGTSWRVSPGVGKTTCSWIHPSKEKVLFSSTHLNPAALDEQNAELERRRSGKTAPYAWDFDEHYEIFEVAIDGKEGLRQLTQSRGYDAEASWSPDGSKIVFASNRHAYEDGRQPDAQDPSRDLEIYLMDFDGTHVQRLTNSSGYDGGPFFSNDGRKITWRRFSHDGRRAEVWTMNIDGSDQKQITHLGVMSWAPFFHPSGDYIIFATNLQGHANFELYMVRSDGKGEPIRVTDTPGFDGLPVFLNNGHELAWTSSRGGSSQIYMAKWDDAAARRLLGLTTPEITPEDLMKHVEALTDQRLEGRLAGTDGEKKAAEYIATIFEQLGLEPAGDDGTYFQKFTFGADKKTGINVLARMRSNTSNGRAAILVGGHYDHLGRGEAKNSRAHDSEKGKIHFGADDNASGTAGVLEIAEALSNNIFGLKPIVHDIIFAAWSGEELGLLGSSYFTKANMPPIAAYLNMDMIGRYRDKLSVQGAGSADWGKWIDASSIFSDHLTLSIQNDPYLPTDAMSLYLAHVPVLSAFTGTHDEYHTPRDTADRLNFASMYRIATWVGALTSMLATSDSTPTYIEVPATPNGNGHGPLKIYVGTIPDYGAADGVGLRVSGVRSESPAAQAGIKAGDVIIEVVGRKIRNIEDYMAALALLRAREAARFTILRGDQLLELTVVPSSKD